MKIISRLRGRKFCAYCRSPRQLYVKKHVDVTNVVALTLLSAAVTYGIWGEPDPRGGFIFCSLMVGAEIFVYLRWRAAIVCTMCGFDPLVYKKSPATAAKMVNQFYQERRSDPRFLLSRSPLLEVHRRAILAEKRKRDRDEFEMLKANRLNKTREPVRVATEPTVR